jgi:hypothetical protein
MDSDLGYLTFRWEKPLSLGDPKIPIHSDQCMENL